MRVTRFQFPLEKSFVDKLDIVCKRLTRKSPKSDAVFIFEGKEGEGKTTYGVATAYYISEKAGKEFNQRHVFFDLGKMIQFAQETEGQIMIWDEPSLQALSTDARKKIVEDLKRLLMTARKKRHCIIICMTKFWHFSEYIVVDRALFIVHVYAREDVPGRFIYIRGKFLQNLWNDYKFKRQRNYFKYGSFSVRGTFPDVLNPDYEYNVLKEFDVKAYEVEKDKGIASIGKDEKRFNVDKAGRYEKNIVFSPHLTDKQKAETLGITTKSVFNIRKKWEEIGYIHDVGLKKRRKDSNLEDINNDVDSEKEVE